MGGVTAGGGLACDPLPPSTAVSKYDEAFFEGVEDVFAGGGRRARTRRERALDERRLAQVIPDAAFRRQLQVCYFVVQSIPARELIVDILLTGLFRSQSAVCEPVPGGYCAICAGGRADAGGDVGGYDGDALGRGRWGHGRRWWWDATASG